MAERKRSPGRFRPVEKRQAGRAVVAQPVGHRPARLAHRVLGHEPAAAGRDVRHPRRRARPGLPASRKRNRPERMLPRQAAGQVLDAQRPDAGRGRGRQGRRPEHAGRRCRSGCHWLCQCRQSARRSGRPASRQDQQIEGRQRVPRFAGSASAETIRFFLLSTHYRRPIDYSEERLRETARSLDGFYRFFKRLERVSDRQFFDLPSAAIAPRANSTPPDNRCSWKSLRCETDSRSDGRRFQHRRRHRRAVRASASA